MAEIQKPAYSRPNNYGTQGEPSGPVKLSVVIPAWSGTPELAQMALDLCKQVRPMCDELILTEDSGNYYKELQEIADLYLMHENLGDVVNTVLGMRIALGEYIAAINTDVHILMGSVRSLCIPGKTVTPWEKDGNHQEFNGAFYVIPRTVLNEYGPPLITRQAQGADFEYMYRIQKTFQWSSDLCFTHQLNTSHIEWRKQHEVAEPLNGRLAYDNQ